jgi:hypothetical protein
MGKKNTEGAKKMAGIAFLQLQSTTKLISNT